MLCSLTRPWCTQSIVLTEKGGSALTRWCVLCFLEKKHAAFKWKDAISGFPVSPGSAEAPVRWGGKIKYILIAYLLGNIHAKNCRNRTVYVKIIASCKGGAFFWDSAHCVSKNVTTLSRYNSNKCESVLIIFGTYVTVKVGNQKVLYFPTSPN